MIWDFVFLSGAGEDVEHYSINSRTENMNKLSISPHTRLPRDSWITKNKPVSNGDTETQRAMEPHRNNHGVVIM